MSDVKRTSCVERLRNHVSIRRQSPAMTNPRFAQETDLMDEAATEIQLWKALAGEHYEGDFSVVEAATDLLTFRREGPCGDCGKTYTDWVVPHALWNEVVPDDGLLCFLCFSTRWERHRGGIVGGPGPARLGPNEEVRPLGR